MEAVLVRTDVVTKEITALVRRSATAGAAGSIPAASGAMRANRQAVEVALEWFQALLAEARMIAAKGSFGIFGTSISANWLFAELEPSVEYFIEEDPNRVGTIYRDRPVLHPADVPHGGNVYMALPRALGAQIVHRINPVNARFYLAPSFKQTFEESPPMITTDANFLGKFVAKDVTTGLSKRQVRHQ
jgi:hypothetical protein